MVLLLHGNSECFAPVCECVSLYEITFLTLFKIVVDVTKCLKALKSDPNPSPPMADWVKCAHSILCEAAINDD